MNHRIYPMVAALASLAMADGPKLTGYVTTTWNKDFNSPASGYSSADAFNYYGGKDASFQLDAFHLNIAGGDAAGATYVVDLDAGKNSYANVGAIKESNAKWGLDLQQAYVAIPFGKTPIGLQAGKFYTSEGIEVLNSGLNPTVTRGLLFGQMECVAHTGAILTAKIGDKLNVAAGAVNGWDVWSTPDNDGLPMAYGRVSVGLGDPLSATLSAYYGSAASVTGSRDDFMSLDLTGITKIVPNLDLNFQGNYEFKGAGDKDLDSKVYGAGLQPLYHFNSAAQLGLRYELFYKDLKGSEKTVNSISLAPGYKVTPNSLLRVEYRIDIGADKYFETDDGMSKVDQVVTAELNYTF